MHLVRATTDDIDPIRRLMRRARHTYQNFAREDWHDLLDCGAVVLGFESERASRAWRAAPVALLGLRPEARPLSLPAAAPSRAYLRCAAVARGRSATADLPPLFREIERALLAQDGAHRGWQLIYYDADGWLVRPLLASGFDQVDRVQFLQLERLSRHIDAINERLHAALSRAGEGGRVSLRVAQPDDVPALAALDAETFDSLWHMGERDLMGLLMTSHVCVATLENEREAQGSASEGAERVEADNLLGYVSIAMREGQAMLSRLAVHPLSQGRGMGRLLLMDALREAHKQGIETVVLNTQTSNARSYALYRSLGFRRTGEIFPVLTRVVTEAT